MDNLMQTNPTDSMIKRGRISRWVVAVLSPLIACYLCYQLGIKIVEVFNFYIEVGKVLGAGAGFASAWWLIERSIIRNTAIQAFVTINPLATLLNLGNALVSYGPGTHPDFWWETRESGNNVNLEAVAESFSGVVQCADGTLTEEGEFRLRPDITRLPEFISGVATASSNLSGLIEAEIATQLSTQEVMLALSQIEELNKRLHKKFVHGGEQTDGVMDLEKMYGIVIADVTVSKLLPSKDVRETMSAITEARIIAQEVQKFICTTKGIPLGDYAAAVKDGRISQADVGDTRDRIMAMSGNLQGMNLSKQQFDINVMGLENFPKDLVPGMLAAAEAVARFRGNNRTNAPREQKGKRS